MIKLIGQDNIANAIIHNGFLRSFGLFTCVKEDCFCFISPNEQDFPSFQRALASSSKIIVLGALPASFAEVLGLQMTDTAFCQEKAKAVVDSDVSHNASAYHVHYGEHALLSRVPYQQRYFERFDFTNEWNNLGYGRISVANDIWSLSQSLMANGAKVLAEVRDEDGFVSVFASVTDFEQSSVLYINRAVGLVDGLDWGLVEHFFADHRSDALPVLPLISDLPAGCSAVASSRLDCDQSIINSRPLVDLYKRYDIDISLAISTGIPIADEDISFMKSFAAQGGSLVSHTVTHHYGWGRDYQHAFEEAKQSKDWLEANLDMMIHYAVSPFHSNPPYAVQALKDAGYKGFISGIIHNDPEYLCAVSGQVPLVEGDMVMHAQQSMMHGDCFHRYGNSVEPYQQAFDAHVKAGKMFGYLDHPFGGYDYGWHSEEERLDAHERLIQHINQQLNVRWMTLDEILTFVSHKNQVRMSIDMQGKLSIEHKDPSVQVYYRGEWY